MQVECPECTQPFEIPLDSSEATCPNRECHAPYRFRMFLTLDDCVDFDRTISSWRGKRLFAHEESGAVRYIVAYFDGQIERYQIHSMSSLIGIEILQAIQAGSAENIGAPLTVVEIDHNGGKKPALKRIEPLAVSGERTVPAHMRRFTSYCRSLRQSTDDEGITGDRVCEEFDLEIIDQYLRNPPYHSSWHYCWCNLIDYIVPLIVQGEIVGVLLSGQRRLADSSADSERRVRVRSAAHRFGLDVDTMLKLSQSRDVKQVTQDEIVADLRGLEEVAHRLQAEAFQKYSSERQVRDSYFLEEVDSIVAGAIRTPLVAEDDVWSHCGKILARLRRYLHCYEGVALLLERPSGTRSHVLVASDGLVFSSFSKDLTQPRGGQPKHSGTGVAVIDGLEYLQENFSNTLFPFKIGTGRALRLSLKSERNFLLVAASPRHACGMRAVKGFCEQESGLSSRFMLQFGNNLATGLDILLYTHDTRAEEKRKESFLVRAAHTLSLPVQSIIADSAVLADLATAIRDQHPELYDVALHNLNGARELDMVVQNTLHWDTAGIHQPRPEFNQISILEPLSEACQMLEGEAHDKGCAIDVVLVFGDEEYSFAPHELSSALILYTRLIIDPIRRSLGLPEDKIILRNEFRAIVESRSCDLEDLAEHCAGLVRDAGIHRDVLLDIAGRRVQVDASRLSRYYIPRVDMVRDELALAFKNLIHNAVKYSFRAIPGRERRYVKVKCEFGVGGICSVSISNYGVGILLHEIGSGSIWRSGYRGLLSRDRNRTGAGLGLNHAKYAIEEVHHGRISVASMEQTGGAYVTVFTVTLPINQSA